MFSNFITDNRSLNGFVEFQSLNVSSNPNAEDTMDISKDGLLCVINDSSNSQAYAYLKSGASYSLVYTFGAVTGISSVSVSSSPTGYYIAMGFEADAQGVGGSVKIFSLDVGSPISMSHIQTITAPSTQSNARFGCDVAFSNDGSVLAVGERYRDYSTYTDAGVIRVFTGSGGTWSYDSTLYPSTARNSDEFGTNVEISADGTVIMSLADGPYTTFLAGELYIFENIGSPSSWTETYTDEGTSGAHWQTGSGASLSFDGNTVAVPTTNGIRVYRKSGTWSYSESLFSGYGLASCALNETGDVCVGWGGTLEYVISHYSSSWGAFQKLPVPTSTFHVTRFSGTSTEYLCIQLDTSTKFYDYQTNIGY